MWPHARTHLKCRTFAKRDWADHHMAIFQVYDAERRVLPDGNIVANVKQVPTALKQINAPVDVDSLPNARPQCPQNHHLKFSTRQQLPRDRTHDLLNDPVANIETSPYRRALGPVLADQQSLGKHSGHDRNGRVNKQ